MRLKKTIAKPRFDPRIDGVSQSMLGSWLECREMARLGIVVGLESTGAAKPLVFGALGHSALCNAYRKNRKSVTALIQGVKDDLAFAEREFDEERGDLTSAGMDIKLESLAVLRRLLPAYYSKWGADDLKRDWTRIEEKFRILIPMPDGTTVPYVGKMDGTYRGRKTPHLFETKFKSQFSANLTDTLPLDTQVGAYTTALTSLEQQEPGGILYNLIRRPGQKRKQEESLDEYAKRVAEEAMKNQDHFFQRLEIILTRQEKEEHSFRLSKLVEEFYAWWKQTSLEKRDLMWNGSRCDQYGGCRFLPVCSRGDRASFRVKEKAHPEL